MLAFTTCARAGLGLLGALGLTWTATWASAQDIKPVYRCPGPPVLYTDSLSAQEAKDKGCRTIEGAPITVVQSPKPRPASASNGATVGATRPGDTKVDPASQRSRDSDARRILLDELQREEERLAAMQAEFKGGEPDRKGDERNFARYSERVAEMRAAIQRKEADIAAIKREMAKLPP
jgi:Xaa-Pro aminopeptidase